MTVFDEAHMYITEESYREGIKQLKYIFQQLQSRQLPYVVMSATFPKEFCDKFCEMFVPLM